MIHPSVSIITCTYNSETYLADAISSVEKQQLAPDMFEHIFVDAESSDKTLDIIADYKKRNPLYRIRVISQKAKGIYNAMNIGIQEAKWEYILFLHSDDFLVPHALLQYLHFVQKTGSRDLYFAQQYNYSEAMHKTPSLSSKIHILGYLWMHKLLLAFSVYVSQPTTLYHRDVFRRFGYFDEQYKIIGDLVFHTILCGKVSYKYYPHYVTHFRIHGDSTSSGSIHKKVLAEVSSYAYEQYPRPLAWLIIMYHTFYFRFLMRLLFY